SLVAGWAPPPCPSASGRPADVTRRQDPEVERPGENGRGLSRVVSPRGLHFFSWHSDRKPADWRIPRSDERSQAGAGTQPERFSPTVRLGRPGARRFSPATSRRGHPGYPRPRLGSALKALVSGQWLVARLVTSDKWQVK